MAVGPRTIKEGFMLFYFLKRTFSGLWQDRESSLLTMISLAIGLSLSSLIYLHVKQEVSHDRLWPDGQVIYRVLEETVGAGTITATLPEFRIGPLLDHLDDLVQSTASARFLSTNILYEDHSVYIPLQAVDASFLDVFQTEVLAGSLEQVLRQPGLIALEEGQARAIFGDATASMGATVTIEGLRGMQFVNGVPNITKGEDVPLEVAAIFRLPEPVSHATDFAALTMRGDQSAKLLPLPFSISTLWIKLTPDNTPVLVQQALDDYADRYSGGAAQVASGQPPVSYRLRLEPLRDIYFHSAENPLLAPHGDPLQLATFIAVGVLVLLVSATNAVCINLAAVPGRVQEVGILKSLGAERSQIALQFLGGSVALALLALLPALGLIGLLRPVFEGLLFVPALPSLDGVDVAVLVGFAVLLGVIVGYYPALVLARQRPMRSLAPSLASLKGGLNFRTVLLAGQFAVAIFLVVATLAVYAQLRVTARQPLGFEPSNLAAVQGDFGSGIPSAMVLVNALEGIPGVRMARPINNQPNTQGISFANEALLVRSTDDQNGVVVENRTIGFDSFGMLGVPMLAGREFDLQRDVDYRGAALGQRVSERIVINRQAAAALGFADAGEAVGKPVLLRRGSGNNVVHEPATVIGVVEDHMYFDLTRRPSAEIYRLMPAVQNSSSAF
ncbi:MAG TPA: FtsX-like permease family protein, partial [Hyphomicrobiales bacterium]|nr:FtsX-like permease family protein [Hyphomicrobiales bacterium]